MNVISRAKGHLLLVGLVVVGVMLLGATQTWAVSEGQNRLLAKRAATVDAYRNLTERIKGLKIESQTYVRDFVAESDTIRSAVDTFIKGVRIVGSRYLPDGTCEVTVEVTLEQLMAALQKIYKTYPSGRTYVFEKMINYTRHRVISAVGQGVPRGETFAPAGPVAAEPSEMYMPEGWENVSSRGRLMAERAARLDAYRNLAERVRGLRITSETFVRDFVAESDQIKTQLDTFIKGARVVGPFRYLPEGIVEVDVEITIQEVVKRLKTIYTRHVQRGWNWRREYFTKANFEEIVGYAPKKILGATGSGVVPEKYRGQTQARVVLPAEIAGPAEPSAPQRPMWVDELLSARGVGLPPVDASDPAEARLLAERAAKIDALRNLTEKVYGIYIDSKTTVNDYTVGRDDVRGGVEALISGAEVSEPMYRSDGSVQVEVRLALQGVWDQIQKQ